MDQAEREGMDGAEALPSRAVGVSAPATPIPVYAPAGPVFTPARRTGCVWGCFGLIGMVSAGMFLGDFSSRKGVPGTVVQAAMGYIPFVGSVVAIRDAFACSRKGDRIGVSLNLLAFLPIIGGVAKTAAAVRDVRNIGVAMADSYYARQAARAVR